jgi:hypothetical protein
LTEIKYSQNQLIYIDKNNRYARLGFCSKSATEHKIMKVCGKVAFVFICGGAAAMLFAGAASLMTSRPASAKPEYAAQTGLPCGRCHVNPSGGGKNTTFGDKYKANGHKVPK